MAGNGIDFITTSDRVEHTYITRGLYSPTQLREMLEDINIRIRRVLQSLAGRDIRVNLPYIELDFVPNDRYNARGELDPYHDEGNGTNHRLSQCTERCR